MKITILSKEPGVEPIFFDVVEEFWNSIIAPSKNRILIREDPETEVILCCYEILAGECLPKETI